MSGTVIGPIPMSVEIGMTAGPNRLGTVRLRVLPGLVSWAGMVGMVNPSMVMGPVRLALRGTLRPMSPVMLIGISEMSTLVSIPSDQPPWALGDPDPLLAYPDPKLTNRPDRFVPRLSSPETNADSAGSRVLVLL